MIQHPISIATKTIKITEDATKELPIKYEGEVLHFAAKAGDSLVDLVKDRTDESKKLR